MSVVSARTRTWALTEIATNNSNSTVDKTLRMMKAAFEDNMRMGDPMPYALTIGERPVPMGVLQGYEAPGGDIMDLLA